MTATTEAALRETWEQLERDRAAGRNAQDRCNSSKCRAFKAGGPLCFDCNQQRLELKERFTRHTEGSNG